MNPDHARIRECPKCGFTLKHKDKILICPACGAKFRVKKKDA